MFIFWLLSCGCIITTSLDSDSCWHYSCNSCHRRYSHAFCFETFNVSQFHNVSIFETQRSHIVVLLKGYKLYTFIRDRRQAKRLEEYEKSAKNRHNRFLINQGTRLKFTITFNLYFLRSVLFDSTSHMYTNKLIIFCLLEHCSISRRGEKKSVARSFSSPWLEWSSITSACTLPTSI